MKQRFAIERIKHDKSEVKHVQTKTKQSIVMIVTITLSYIVSSVIKAVLNFDYTPFRDGLGIKLLLDFGLYVLVFTVIYYFTSRLLCKRG
ncbi:hypothetical protein HMI01_12290 [Halolactibacillus miurensis]|uniref:Uncharacterized protein n=1 Tax=Halolactibacillus miurensis TaxID=306541 RepID=A0A1I6T066_9BACI|nr:MULTISPECIES: hypothetical protein [Halolactibacillus]GEM04241.1 hypothetical protein HMI01_12290 [Halolactibacillus miurensis]SFS82478.1 hypothetical protein SAMN05421668_11185 [Halolactibacillus miurensis]